MSGSFSPDINTNTDTDINTDRNRSPNMNPINREAETEIATLQRIIRKIMLDLYEAGRTNPDIPPKRIDFISSVWEQFSSTGCISPKQWDYMQTFHNEYVACQDIILPGSFHATVAMLQLSAEHKKWPKMKFAHAKGEYIALIWNKSRGRAVLTNGYAKSNWAKHFVYGRLHADGKLHIKGKVDERPEWPSIQSFLSILAADPIQAAKMSAAITGNCCFCDSELTDPESKSRGYGPICAEHQELPWGDKSNVRTIPLDLGDLFTTHRMGA